MPRFLRRGASTDDEAGGSMSVARSDTAAERSAPDSLDESPAAERQLDAAPMALVCLDRRARITSVNEAWRKLAREAGADDTTHRGADYPAAARRIFGESAAGLAHSLARLQQGLEPWLGSVYPCHTATELRWFRVEARWVEMDDAIIVFHTNVTDQHLAEACLRVQAVATQCLADRTRLPDTCRRIMRAMCESLAWEFAAVWMPKDAEVLECTDVWTNPDLSTRKLEQETRAIEFRRRQGLPGTAWASGSLEWCGDLSGEPDWPRSRSATAIGLQSSFAVPLGAEGEVIAVLEFFSRVRREPDLLLIEMLVTASAQLGAQLLRERAEQRALTAEAARSRILSTLEAVFECAPAFIIVVDHRGLIQLINRVLSHHKKEDVIGSSWLDYIPPTEHGEHHARMQRILQTGVSETYDTTIEGPEGRKLWFSTYIGPLRQGDRIVGAVLVAQDVTELRTTQTEYMAAQRLAAVGTLAAGVAHEINTPVQFVSDSIHFLHEALGDVFGLVERLLRVKELAAAGSAGSELQEAIRTAAAAEDEADLEYLQENVPNAFERCVEGIGRVGNIVRSMKEFAHPAQIEMAPADLNRAIQNTLTIASNEYKYVANLETDLGDLPPVTCNVNDINQVVLNLIVNAAHAIGDVVKHTSEKGTLRVRTRRDGDHAVIMIGDTGSGIPDSIAERVFEPFFTTKEVGRGTGQGLALSWRLITDKHGGELSFETQSGQGTTFHVRLPITGKKKESKAS